MLQQSIAEDDTALDNPIWTALTGTDRHLSEGGERARRYRPDVSRFTGLADERDPEAWAELAELAAGEHVSVLTDHVPDGWTVERAVPLIQMVYAGPPAPFSPAPHEFAPLTHADVADMLALVEETKPGPFAPATIEFGGYRGLRADGALICMAGERVHPGEWTEISAVCTAPGHQGRGLAGAIVTSLVRDIIAAGRRPYLNVAAANAGARHLYEKLGFSERTRMTVHGVRRA
jgi:ribosomal protein S18 acetylase RimI-like enzyme